VIIGPRYGYKTFRADQVFIPEQVITTRIAKPWKEKADKIIPQIIDKAHAAESIVHIKVLKIFQCLIRLNEMRDSFPVKKSMIREFSSEPASKDIAGNS
jgi:hypothetical protein